MNLLVVELEALFSCERSITAILDASENVIIVTQMNWQLLTQ